MGFKSQALATAWEVSVISDTMTKVRLSTSKKSRTQEGAWETDFSGYVCFVGAANAKAAAQLSAKERIRLGDVEVTTSYNKDTKVNYTNYFCYGFEPSTGTGTAHNSGSHEPDATARAEAISEQVEDVISDGAIPF